MQIEENRSHRNGLDGCDGFHLVADSDGRSCRLLPVRRMVLSRQLLLLFRHVDNNWFRRFRRVTGNWNPIKTHVVLN